MISWVRPGVFEVRASDFCEVSALIALFAFWPFSGNRQELMQQANALLMSNSPDDWRDARKIYEKIMRSSNAELAAEAEEKYYLARRKSMLFRLDRGFATGLEKPEIRAFSRG